MIPEELLMEEYKQLYSSIARQQAHYTKVEQLTISGILLIYGFLVFNDKPVPAGVWWTIPILTLLPAARCIAYYALINLWIAPYLRLIESSIYDGPICGFQNYLASSGSRRLNLVFNATVWLAIVCGTACVAAWHVSMFGK